MSSGYRSRRQEQHHAYDDDEEDDFGNSGGNRRHAGAYYGRMRPAERDYEPQQPPPPKREESFVVFGTQQAPTDGGAKAAEAFVPVWKQEVRDEQGRKRLHGAFKGGFSAGYFNTVGSKEGWQPATFQSSRSQRTDKKQMRPEDFMDEEDIEDARENTRIASKSGFNEFGSAADGQTASSSAGLLADLSDVFVLPAKESYGVKLLTQMGWRQGQGLGPRVHRKNEEDAFAGHKKFAPAKDTVVVAYTAKNDRHGLGYASSTTAPVRLEKTADITGRRPKSALPMQGGIGVGVLNEGDDDVLDGDVYESLSTADQYDISRTQEEDREKRFFPPSAPPDWQPTAKRQTANVTPPAIPAARLTTEERSRIIGEEPLAAPPRSVFDLLKPEDKSRLQAVRNSTQAEAERSERERKRRVSKQVAEAALRGFIPFQQDVTKQARYRRYLEVCAGQKSDYMAHPDGLESDAAEREYQEFHKAAQIFQPMSGALAMKFTSAATMEVNDIKGGVQAKVAKPIPEDTGSTADPTEHPAVTAARMGMFGRMTRTSETFYPSRLLCKRFNVPNPHPQHKDSQDDNDRRRDRDLFERAEPTRELLNADTMRQLIREQQGVGQTARRLAQGGRSPDVALSPKVPSAIEELAEFKRQMGAAEPDQLQMVDEPDLPERPPMDIFHAVFGDSDAESDHDPSTAEPHTTTSSVKGPSAPPPVVGDYVPREQAAPKVNVEGFKPVFRKRADRQPASVAAKPRADHRVLAPNSPDQTIALPAGLVETGEDAPMIVTMAVQEEEDKEPEDRPPAIVPHVIARELVGPHAGKRSTPADNGDEEDADQRDRKTRKKSSSSGKSRRKHKHKHKSKGGSRKKSSSRGKEDASSSSSGSEQEIIQWVEKSV
ncbi:hypothetical protein RI367_003768 [Sorochytrium milnesiophthora]